MYGWAFTLAIIALVAAVLGFGGLAGAIDVKEREHPVADEPSEIDASGDAEDGDDGVFEGEEPQYLSA